MGHKSLENKFKREEVLEVPRPLLSRSRLNLFSKLLLDNFVISGALICQTRVKCERKNKVRGIPIFDLPPEFQEASRPKVIGEE